MEGPCGPCETGLGQKDGEVIKPLDELLGCFSSNILQFWDAVILTLVKVWMEHMHSKAVLTSSSLALPVSAYKFRLDIR